MNSNKHKLSASQSESSSGAYKQRSEAVKFAAIADLPPGMANLLRADQDAQYHLAREEVARLDSALLEAEARERRVKRDRAVLEMRLRHELDQLSAASNRQGHSEAADNTAKFLALMDSDRLNRSDRNALQTAMGPEFTEQSRQPVFQTECPSFEDETVDSNDDQDDAASDDDAGKRRRNPRILAQRNRRANKTEELATAARAALTHGKDFVQRNILLAASRADAAVPMTPDQMARVSELLDDGADTELRPDYELSLLRSVEVKQLTEIQAKLDAMNSTADTGSFSSAECSSVPVGPGDPNLASARNARLMERRLLTIEHKLMQSMSSHQ